MIQSVYALDSQEELVALFKKEGIRQPVDLEKHQELREIFLSASQMAQNLDQSCRAEIISEIYLKNNSKELLSGYEIFVSCENTPTPAIALYFNLSLNFLGSANLAD
ncbi:MAG: hypothetical protein HY843_04640 [Bdellovibrio sp.]|nr:hypothetical protein [Bdellovibrio sp.]